MASQGSLQAQFNRIVREYKRKLDLSVTIGVGFSSKEHWSGKTTDELAKMLNYGTANIPARPLLTDGFPEYIDSSGAFSLLVSDYVKSVTQDEVEKKSAVSVLGSTLSESLRGYMKTNPYYSSIPNDADYVKYVKKFNFPWVWHGDLMESVDYVVVQNE